ncbi:MAG: hypothetical protein EA364_11340 [Balneolaceae bacterium]|nr:MAG: hypothetical protein EA364_11340 [Balneolaceae bacterium]
MGKWGAGEVENWGMWKWAKSRKQKAEVQGFPIVMLSAGCSRTVMLKQMGSAEHCPADRELR